MWEISGVVSGAKKIAKEQMHVATRMYSSRMRTARSLTISCHILCMPPPEKTMHAPWKNHTCPPEKTMHTCLPPKKPSTPPGKNHAHPPRKNHAHMPPEKPHTPPSQSNHAHPPHCGQTDTCKNITFTNFICGR